LTGLLFGRLTALRLVAERRGGKVIWHCRCSCGTECIVAAAHLVNGEVRSCGCLRRDTAGQSQRTPAHRARDAAMRREREQGATLADLGRKYGLTRQRVGRIVGPQA
jgi:hypothetical protein